MLPNNDRKIFNDVREVKPTSGTTSKPTIKKREKPVKTSPSSSKTSKPTKQKVGKVSCTFHLPENLRKELQALSFMTDTPQNKIVEKAIVKAIKSSGLSLPRRAA